MAEETKIPGTKQTPLTREEYVAKEKALANMKAMTMRRGMFNTLQPSHVVPRGDVLRQRAIALIIDRDKTTRILGTHILLDDQTLIAGPYYPEGSEDWPVDYQYLLELPRVQVA